MREQQQLSTREQATQFIGRLQHAWTTLTPTHRILAVTCAAIAVVCTLYMFSNSATCVTRSDAETRLAELMQELQQSTANGSLSLDALAQRVTEINAAATAFESSNDAHTFCEALDRIR